MPAFELAVVKYYGCCSVCKERHKNNLCKFIVFLSIGVLSIVYQFYFW